MKEVRLPSTAPIRPIDLSRITPLLLDADNDDDQCARRDTTLCCYAATVQHDHDGAARHRAALTKRASQQASRQASNRHTRSV